LTRDHRLSPLSRLYLVTDRAFCAPRSLEDVLDEACAAGARMVQLREKDLPPRELCLLAEAAKTVADRHGASLFVNDRIDIAMAVDAAGVHLSRKSVPPSIARRCLNEAQLIGVSTHSVEEAMLAEQDGANFICFGPVYDTPSKRPYGSPQGLRKLREVCNCVSVPVYAIGGISHSQVDECIGAGAYGVAVISAVIGAADVTDAVSSFSDTLGT